MPQSTFANSRGVAHKSSSGMSIVFPDVCITPGAVAGAPSPLPYPSTYSTAVKAQQKAQTPAPAAAALQAIKAATGNAPGTLKGIVSLNTQGPAVLMQSAQVSVQGRGLMGITGSPALANNPAQQAELAQIRGALDQLHGHIKGCTSDDPNQWQALLQEYTVNASALYLTLNG